MKVAIVTEGGNEIGLGHITRCIALSQSLLERGIKPIFMVNDDKAAKWFLDRAGANSRTYTSDSLLERLDGFKAVIVDSYKLPRELYIEIGKRTDRLLCIDDFNRLAYPEGIVLNAAINAENIKYPKKEGIKYLLGAQYIAIRKDFIVTERKHIKEKIRSILITLGGRNRQDMCLRTLKLIDSLFSDIEIFVNAGLEALDKDAIQPIKRNSKNNINLLHGTNTLKEFMVEADLCISGGGQTTYELASIGTPAVGICLAENQRLNLQGWQDVGFIEFAGQFNESGVLNKVKSSIEKLLQKKKRLKSSRIGRSFVDGRGSQRVIEEFI